jgi:peptide-methionine (S)-S-oxide reductase
MQPLVIFETGPRLFHEQFYYFSVMKEILKQSLIFICLSAFIACGNSQGTKTDFMKRQNTDYQSGDSLEHAVLGAGCFWCVEAIFQEINGVISVESGYAGGKIKNPTYKEVSTGESGHAEVAYITFEQGVVSFESLLIVFFHTHDPTTKDMQGADVGTQYRSVVFYLSEDQKKVAEKVKNDIGKSGLWQNPIVTDIEPLTIYYKAENYHQDYFKYNPNQPYCSYVISPKLDKLRKEFKHLLKEESMVGDD